MMHEIKKLDGKTELSQESINKILRFRLIAFAIVVVVLSVLSVNSTLDNLSSEHVETTMTETAALLAISVAIDSTVSALQTVEWELPFMKMIVGKVFEPLDDKVEQLSDILTWAFGSLFLQAIFLDIASSWVFKWIFFGAGTVAFLGLLLLTLGRLKETISVLTNTSKLTLDRFCVGTIRVFVFLAVLRFIMPVFVGASFIASEMLLQPGINEHRVELSSVNKSISIDDLTEVSEDADSDQGNYQQEMDGKLSELAVLRDSRDDIDRKIVELDAKIDELNKDAGLGRFVPKFLGGEAAPNAELVSLKETREDLKHNARDIEDKIETKNSEIECVERKMEGKSCDSIFNRLFTDKVEKLKKFAADAQNSLVSISKLLILIAVKNVALPILFLAIALKFSLDIIKWGNKLGLSLNPRKGIQDIRKELGVEDDRPQTDSDLLHDAGD